MKFIMFPLIFLLIVVYALMAVVIGDMAGVLDKVVISINLMSGAEWNLTGSTIFIVAGLFLLFIEILKATKIDSASMVNNGLSMGVFVIALVLFIVLPDYGNSTFFIITTMALLDAIAGFTITAVTARRDIGFG
ncbi:MAG: hypothetical protein EP340_09475 [Alphaproteobacteria bacterium]|nr:MAG: hypothetical protein EP340_09475 [Alphaproteobacteria bacterium]